MLLVNQRRKEAERKKRRQRKQKEAGQAKRKEEGAAADKNGKDEKKAYRDIESKE